MKAETTFNEYEHSKKKAHTKKSKGPVKHVTVKPVAGGFISEAEHEDMSDGKEPMMYGMGSRTKKHHKTAEDVGSHMSKIFGGKKMVPVGEGAEEESEAAGAGDPNESAEKE